MKRFLVLTLCGIITTLCIGCGQNKEEEKVKNATPTIQANEISQICQLQEETKENTEKETNIENNNIEYNGVEFNDEDINIKNPIEENIEIEISNVDVPEDDIQAADDYKAMIEAGDEMLDFDRKKFEEMSIEELELMILDNVQEITLRTIEIKSTIKEDDVFFSENDCTYEEFLKYAEEIDKRLQTCDELLANNDAPLGEKADVAQNIITFADVNEYGNSSLIYCLDDNIRESSSTLSYINYFYITQSQLQYFESKENK